MSENRWHQCSQNSFCNGEFKCIVYLCCCFLPVNWCRSYSFNVQIFPWNLLYKTEDLLPSQRFCYQWYHTSCLPSVQRKGHGSCAVTHAGDGCRSLGAVLRTGTTVWELCLPFPAHINISEKYQFDLERDRNKYRMGKGTGKRKIAWLEGEGEKWPRKGKWRQTERQRKNCFSFYEEREPSNQDDWVQLFRPLYTHELAIKCGSGKQKTS